MAGMNLDGALALIRDFMVPPAADGDPPLGWPDGVEPPPPALEIVSSADTSNTQKLEVDFVSLGIAAGELVGGALSAPPFWDGAMIKSNTTTNLTMFVKARNPAGIQTEVLVASSNNQTSWTVTQTVGEVISIKRIADGAILAVSGFAGSVITSGAASPAIALDDEVEIQYFADYAGPIPAGTAGTIARPKDPVAGLSTGEAWSKAFRAIVITASANGIGVVDAVLDPCEAAMKEVIDVMMSVPGLGPVALGGGLTAFWAAFAGISATAVPGSLSTVPPIAAIAAAIASLQPGGPAFLGLLACIPSDPWTPAAAESAALILAGVLLASAQGALVTFSGPAAFPLL